MSLRVLIVEDEPTIRVVLKQILSKIGFPTKQIHEATNGKEGINVLEKNPVDLILTDINMPVMNGLEMLGYIRTQPDLVEIPTVVVTSINDERLVKAVTQSGMGYVHKPVKMKLLKNQLLSFNGCNYEVRAQRQNL